MICRSHKIFLAVVAAAYWFCGNSLCNAQLKFLDDLDKSLFIQSSNGWFRADLSGLVDLEGYYVDQLPPGLLFNSDDFFFNPRLSLFLDVNFGKHFYSMVQARVDRGFDPGVKAHDARFDEYLLRYKPFDDSRLNIQVGKFATVFGNWVSRHDSWNNPFINAPLPYENIVTITDHNGPPSATAFLARRNLPDNKRNWLAQIWGPSYASGASAFGMIKQFDYALEIKNTGLSSRPSLWSATDVGWEHPTFTGRVGYRPNAMWNIGASASSGSYLAPDAATNFPRLPAGTGLGDYNQNTVGTDITFAAHHWQLWAEAMASSFEVPNVGDADMVSYYVEAKYKITPHIFAAARWNQQFFDKVPTTTGMQRWDNDIWRAEIALGWRFDRHVQTKLQYSYSHQHAAFQQGEQMVAVQLTVKF